MNIRMSWLAAALAACAAPVWAAATLPAYETYSAATDSPTNFFGANTASYTPQSDVTSTPGATPQISGSDYTAAARTTLGSNHVYASVSAMPGTVLGTNSFSGWYDQVTITGGTGSGIAHFTVHLTGTVDVGAFAGGASYILGSSSVHPSELAGGQNINIVDAVSVPVTQPWALSAANPIASYSIGVSPYNDTSILFPTMPPPGLAGGIPAIPNPNPVTEIAPPDLILTPGSGQIVDLTLHGTLEFTYGESFYLIGGLGVGVYGDGLHAFCAFPLSGDTCTPSAKDGSGATTLDFLDSALLTGIVLPQGASLASASGAAYNVTAVPEPGEWAMLLAGLGLVAWRTRRKRA